MASLAATCTSPSSPPNVDRQLGKRHRVRSLGDVPWHEGPARSPLGSSSVASSLRASPRLALPGRRCHRRGVPARLRFRGPTQTRPGHYHRLAGQDHDSLRGLMWSMIAPAPRSSLRRRVEHHGHLLHARSHVLTNSSHVAHQLVVREPAEQLREHDAGFPACEVGSEAEVFGKPEREVARVRLASDVELAPLAPSLLVTVAPAGRAGTSNRLCESRDRAALCPRERSGTYASPA